MVVIDPPRTARRDLALLPFQRLRPASVADPAVLATGPFIEILGYIAVFLSYFLGLLNREYLVLFLTVSVFYGIFLSAAAVLVEQIWFGRYPNWLDICKLLLFSIIENLGYRQALSLFKIKAVWDVLRRHRSWGARTRSRFQLANGNGVPAS